MIYVEKFKKAFTKCDDGYVVYRLKYRIPTQSDYAKYSQRNNEQQWYYDLDLLELKNDVHFRIVNPNIYPIKATAADVLNGLAKQQGQVIRYDWDVNLVISMKNIRAHDLKPNRDADEWSKWSDVQPKDYWVYSITKSGDTVEYCHQELWLGCQDSAEIDKTTEFISPVCNIPTKDEIKRLEAKKQRCLLESRLIADKAVERVRKEFHSDSPYNSYRSTPPTKEQLTNGAFSSCLNRQEDIDIDELLAAYDKPLPSIVPEQTWKPNGNYCVDEDIIEEKELHVKFNYPKVTFSLEEIQRKTNDKEWRKAFDDLEVRTKICAGDLREAFKQWESEHPEQN